MRRPILVFGGAAISLMAATALAQTSVDRSFTTTAKNCEGVNWSAEALKAYPNVPYRLARRASLLTAAKSQLIVASVGIAVALAIAAWGLAHHWHNGSSGARQ